MQLGLNGFGRIGRTLVRVLWRRGRHSVVRVNDLNTDEQNLAYLLRNDSTYGRFAGDVVAVKGALHIRDHTRNWAIELSCETDTQAVGWDRSGATVLVEATGTEANQAACDNCVGGALKWSVITHTSPHADHTIIAGVNDSGFDPHSARVIAASICDANAMAPVFRVLSEQYGIEHAFLTTLHPWLAYQNLVDGPVRSRSNPGGYFPDFALGRGSVGCVIPKSTTAGTAVEAVVDGVRGRLSSLSYRVPTASVCYAHVGAVLQRDATSAEVLGSLQAELGSIARFSDEPLVSMDLIGEEASVVVDTRWVSVESNRFLRLSAGYDNEWGYCSRLADLIDRLEDSLSPT